MYFVSYTFHFRAPSFEAATPITVTYPELDIVIGESFTVDKSVDSEATSPDSPSTSTSTVEPTMKRRRTEACLNTDRSLGSVDTFLETRELMSDPRDDAYYFGMTVAARYRRLTRYQQAVASRDIDAALFKAEFEIAEEPNGFQRHGNDGTGTHA